MAIVNIQIPFQDGLTGLVDVPVDVPSTSGGWTEAAGVIRETTTTDQVVIGAAAPVGLAPLEVQQALTQFFQVGSADPFARRQLWSTLLNSVLRLGADVADGDAFNADSEGVVIYKPSLDQMARIKADRLGLTKASDANKYYFRVDGTSLFVKDLATAIENIFKVDQATRQVILGDAAAAVGTMLFINQAAAFNSNAGIQHSSDIANRAQYRGNQFGANSAGPGVTGFKSRGALGTLASVNAGDLLWRATAIGVPADNASIPIAATVSIQVPAGGVGANYVATDFEVGLVPLAGPINGKKQAFLVDSEGVLHVKEAANSMAGVATTGAGGTVVVGNTRVTATTKISLTAQDGGAVPLGSYYVAARVNGVSFTVQSTNAADVGVKVYYQLWEPTVP